jgi:hypothetical protein
MEHLVRVYNEKDRQTLVWLRRTVGDAAIADAVAQCPGPGKPYLSAVCRLLEVKVPAFTENRVHASTPVAEQALLAIRSILAKRATPARQGMNW